MEIRCLNLSSIGVGGLSGEGCSTAQMYRRQNNLLQIYPGSAISLPIRWILNWYKTSKAF